VRCEGLAESDEAEAEERREANRQAHHAHRDPPTGQALVPHETMRGAHGRHCRNDDVGVSTRCNPDRIVGVDEGGSGGSIRDRKRGHDLSIANIDSRDGRCLANEDSLGGVDCICAGP